MHGQIIVAGKRGKTAPVQPAHTITRQDVPHDSDNTLAFAPGLLPRFDALNRCNNNRYLTREGVGVRRGGRVGFEGL